MEKRILGIILSLVGITGLIMAAIYFMNSNAGGGKRIKEIIVYALLGAIFFFSGIGLVRNTKDKAT
jgi:RsiW-degrading membrane proteinase PrsW (M82 family)